MPPRHGNATHQLTGGALLVDLKPGYDYVQHVDTVKEPGVTQIFDNQNVPNSARQNPEQNFLDSIIFTEKRFPSSRGSGSFGTRMRDISGGYEPRTNVADPGVEAQFHMEFNVSHMSPFLAILKKVYFSNFGSLITWLWSEHCIHIEPCIFTPIKLMTICLRRDLERRWFHFLTEVRDRR